MLNIGAGATALGRGRSIPLEAGALAAGAVWGFVEPSSQGLIPLMNEPTEACHANICGEQKLTNLVTVVLTVACTSVFVCFRFKENPSRKSMKKVLSVACTSFCSVSSPFLSLLLDERYGTVLQVPMDEVGFCVTA